MAKVANLQVLNEDLPLQQQIRILQENLDFLFALGQSRIRFGDGTDGFAGENISGEFHSFTSDGTPDTEFAVATAANGTFRHGVGS